MNFLFFNESKTVQVFTQLDTIHFFLSFAFYNRKIREIEDVIER